MNENDGGWKSRKWLIVLAAMVLFTVAAIFDKIEVAQWTDAMWKLVAVYVGGNVLAKFGIGIFKKNGGTNGT